MSCKFETRRKMKTKPKPILYIVHDTFFVSPLCLPQENKNKVFASLYYKFTLGNFSASSNIICRVCNFRLKVYKST